MKKESRADFGKKQSEGTQEFADRESGLTQRINVTSLPTMDAECAEE